MWRALCLLLSLLVVTIEVFPSEDDLTVGFYLSSCTAELDSSLSDDEKIAQFGNKLRCFGYVAGVLDGIRIGAEIIRIRGELEMDLLKDIVALCLPSAPMSTETILSIINAELIASSDITESDTLRTVVFAALARQFRC